MKAENLVGKAKQFFPNIRLTLEDVKNTPNVRAIPFLCIFCSYVWENIFSCVISVAFNSIFFSVSANY